ncbi:MAG: hypothetical protein WCD31_14235, partial [Gillisia sp.]
QISGVVGLVFGMAAIFTTGVISVMFISLLGLANALVWPAIWPLALAGLGRFTKIGASFLIMAIAGGAVIPLIYGALADNVGLQQAYWIVIPCYAFILFFATKGYKRKKTKNFATNARIFNCYTDRRIFVLSPRAESRGHKSPLRSR